MATTSKLAHLPIPERTDRVDGPGAFTLLANKLEQITVIGYNSASVRTTAYSDAGLTPLKGAFSFLKDTNSLEYWDSFKWSPVLPDDYPRGIQYYTYTAGPWPLDGSYVPPNTEIMDTTSDVQVDLVSGRIYRVTYHAGLVDGGPGTSTTTGAAEFRLRYNTNATAPTTSSTLLATGRCVVLGDSAASGGSAHVERIWQCPASGTYYIGVGLFSLNTGGGVRLGIDRGLTVEDLGRLK